MITKIRLNKFDLYLILSILGLITFSFFGHEFRYLGLGIIFLVLIFCRNSKYLLMIFSLTIFIPYKYKVISGIFVNPSILFLLMTLIYLILNLFLRKIDLKEIFSKKNFKSVRNIYIIYFGFLFFIFLNSLISTLQFGFFDNTSFLKLVKIIIYFSSFMIAVYFGKTFNKNDFEMYFNRLFCLIFMYSVFAIYKVFYNITILDVGVYSFEARAMGSFGQYVDVNGVHKIASGTGVLGYIFGILILMSIYNILYNKFSYKYLIGIFVGGVALVLTRSRAAFLGILLGFLFVYLFQLGIKRKLIIIGIIILSIIVVYPLISHDLGRSIDKFYNKLAHTVSVKNGNINFDSSSAGRIDYWSHTLKKVTSTPKGFILGAGWGEYLDLYAKEHITPHSLFVGALGYGGIVGLVMMCAIWFNVFKTLFIMNRINKSIFMTIIIYTLISFWIGFLFNNLISGSELYSDRLSGVIWPILGFTSGYVFKINSMGGSSNE